MNEQHQNPMGTIRVFLTLKKNMTSLSWQMNEQCQNPMGTTRVFLTLKKNMTSLSWQMNEQHQNPTLLFMLQMGQLKAYKKKGYF